MKTSYSTEDIGQILREARENQRLSQRELSSLSGVPQGHISKIEKGAVDLRLSSLIALARSLDLEPTLVPRQAVPAVQSIIRSTERPATMRREEASLAAKELRRLQKTVAGHFSGITQPPNELAQLQRQIRELQNFKLSGSELESIRSARQAFKANLHNTDNVEVIRELLTRLRNLRNALAHASHAPQSETVRPAYSLDEDHNG
jgi:transcriptional regulator with XRE-family HTH domain